MKKRNFKRMISFFLVVITLIVLSTFYPVFAYSNSLAGKKICVDAGHGGSELGEVGKMSIFGGTGKIYEKDMNLTFADILKQDLEDEGATVIMTRTGDTTVSIGERYKLATNKKVDAFISIHFDYDKASRGTRSFYGQTRKQDKTFVQTIHNEVIKATYNKDKGVLDDTNTYDGYLGVLNGGGNFPRTLIEVNNNNYLGMYGCEFLGEAVNFSRGVINGLKKCF